MSDEKETEIHDPLTETDADTDTDSSAAIEGSAPITEDQLLELAQKEGLAEGLEVVEESPEALEAAAKATAELPDEQRANLKASMETILFMSDRPLSLPRLRSVIDSEVPLGVYRALMAELRAEYAADQHGIEIAEVSMGFQFRTKPHMAQVLRKLVKTAPLKLSPTNLEVLAVIAYKQPTTKDELDQIRGVDSGYVIRSLMEKRLVRIVGRSELPGRPMLYGTTHEFLELFSLKDLKSLPPLHEVEQLVAQSEVGDEQAEQEALRGFGKMVENSTQILFDDNGVDIQVEELRAEIASIPTSTPFIEEQKAQEKRAARIAELALEGMTLDENDNIVPIGTVAESGTGLEALTDHSQPLTDNGPSHEPSKELQKAADLAMAERHMEAIASTIDETHGETADEAITEIAGDNPENEPEQSPPA